MGTSVGANALTLKKALVLGAVFEFLGAVTMGSSVAKTISKGKGYVIYTVTVERLEETTANIFKPKLSQQLLNNCYN